MPLRSKFANPIADLLPFIIGSFKSAAIKPINLVCNMLGFSVWQRNYYQHIIRNKKALDNLRQYIINNPLS